MSDINNFRMSGAVVSLKENIEMVKEELNSEERFFENAVKAERFVKKYKNAIIGGVSAFVVLVIANTLYQANNRATLEAANSAYSLLLKNSDDAVAKAELEKLNPELFEMWSLSRALQSKDRAALEKLSTSKAPTVADIASYELAAMSEDAAALEAYSLKPNGIYKELAVVEGALVLLQKGEVPSAHAKLVTVPKESSLYQVAQLLMHYGAK